MAVNTIIREKWNIPKGLQKAFSKKEIESMFRSFSQSCGGDYYMLDYYNNKIFVDDRSSSILCGYPKEIADKEGLDFLKRVIIPTNQDWANQVNKVAFAFFFNYEEKRRMDLTLSYDLGVRTISGSKCVLLHKITPFKLCKNGNLWLGLCNVSEALYEDSKNEAYIVDTEQGKKYNFINGSFVLSKEEVLANKEKQILKLIAKGVTTAEIGKRLGVSETVLNRNKRKIFDKLGVDSSASAIYKAYMEKLI